MYIYLLGASLLANFADSLFGPLYAVYVQNIGGGVLDIGNSIAIYSITTGVLIIMFGKISDFLSKELLIVFGFALGAVGTLSYLVIETPTQLYLLQILFALSTALISAPFQAIFARHIDTEKSGLMWALQGGGSKILAGIGILIGTFITYRYGFTLMFLIVFSLQICATTLLINVFLNSRRK
jgi:MFS family permease